MATPEAGGVKVEKYVVSGGSKRGWTSWATAAVDPRVAAVIPRLDRHAQPGEGLRAPLRVFGFFSEAVKDYVESGVMDWNGTPEYRKLLEIEDPYSYRARFTMPKYMIYAAGDQYFLPDSSRYYFDDLKGEKYLRYIPNTDHGLRNTDARESSLAFYQAFLTGTPRPQFSWKFEANGDIKVTSKSKPEAVKLWQATNPETRDFRLMTIGPAYQSSDLQDQGGGVVRGARARAGEGMDGVLRRADIPERRQVSFQVHDGGAGESGHGAVPGVQAESGEQEVAAMDRRQCLKTLAAAVTAAPRLRGFAAAGGRFRPAICAYSFRDQLKDGSFTYADLIRMAADLGRGRRGPDHVLAA